MTDRHRSDGAAALETRDAEVTRSEEELRVTTYRRAVQRARLTRYVETETVTQTVEIRHEQVRVEYLPIAGRGDERSSSAIGPADGAEQWMVLYDEEVVLTTRRVPRERVRLRAHSIIEDREISDVLRQERTAIDSTDAGR